MERNIVDIKPTATELKLVRNTKLISDYKMLRKVGESKSDILVILQNKYDIKKSLIYQVIKSVENA